MEVLELILSQNNMVPKPKLTLNNMKMANQTTTKLVGLIRDMKIYVHGIPYIITFVVFQNSVVDYNYSMLLERPWLRDVKVAHDWALLGKWGVAFTRLFNCETIKVN